MKKTQHAIQVLKSISIIIGLSMVMGCAQQSEKELSAPEQEAKCGIAMRDRDLFCNEPGLKKSIRDMKCIQARQDIAKYCK